MSIQKMMAMAGRDSDGKAKAIKTDSFGNIEFVEKDKNALLFSTTSNYQIGRYDVFYGNLKRGTTDYFTLLPIDYRKYSKRTVVIKNNLDVDIYISHVYLYTEIQANGNRVEITFDKDSWLVIPVGETKYFSSNDYPELKEPFLGMTIRVRSVQAPTIGDIKIDWLGGN